MLNELYQLSRSMQKCGIKYRKPHQNIKEPGKFEGFIIGINRDGIPQTAEYISADRMHALWTLRQGQHNSFPYKKLKKPIFDVELDNPLYENFKNKKTSLQEKTTILTQVAESYQPNKGQDLSLAEWTKAQLDEVIGRDQSVAALDELVKRMPRDDASSESFLMHMSKVLIKTPTEQTIDLIKLIFVGDKKNKKIVCDASLFFDISDWADKNRFQVRVAHPDMGLLVGQHLPKVESRNGISAFGDSEIQTESYPEPNLNIWKAYLFSMNENAPCHERYKKIGTAIFPASPDEIQSMHGAIKWCVGENRKGRTWQVIPNANRAQDLLISYLAEKPESAINLASFFAAPNVDESITATAVYERIAKSVCDALVGEPGLNDNSQINVIVISKVDEGRAQIALSAAFSRKNIIQSAEEWIAASKNRPPFSLWLPGKKGKKAKQAEPSSPSPTEVMKCFQNQWIKNGLDRREVPGLYLRYVYELFLGEGFIARQVANNFLNLSLRRVGELLIGYGSADHANAIEEYKLDARKNVLYGISTLAIVLYKLGIRKEEYMKNAAFNVGRILALADKLHYAYCWKVRKKDVPPQLIGNAIMRTALDNPQKGLSLLSERLPIYQAWATSVQDDGNDESVTKQVKLAKWILGQLGQVSADMENVTIPVHADDAIKAQIMLGYLAHFKNENQ